MVMKFTLVAIFLGIVLFGCKTVEPPISTCTFKCDTITRGPEDGGILDDQLDSARTYTYQTEQVNMDSLLASLCKQGFEIADAYSVKVYFCSDSRGPRPVVVLKKTDDRMVQQGFWKGSNGRLACGGQIAHYSPKN